MSKRFLPGQTEAEARTTIQLLVQSTDTIVQWCTDFIHQHSRENTISEGYAIYFILYIFFFFVFVCFIQAWVQTIVFYNSPLCMVSGYC